MQLNQEALENMSRLKRLNLVNALSGIKPANLIGTINSKQETNLAIFSSVVHLGSNPALLGFISRPDKKVGRHTLENIEETTYYTINHINTEIAERAHYTSAKFERTQSEFEACNLTEEFLPGFKAPFVKESLVKIGLKLAEIIPIKINDTVMVIGEIQQLILPDEAVAESGHLDLSMLDTIGVSGLDEYHQLKRIASFPYARVDELPDFQ